MIENLFIRFLEISISTSILILAVCLASPYLNKIYAAKWKYCIWLILALRLIIPINISPAIGPLKMNIPNMPVVQYNVEQSIPKPPKVNIMPPSSVPTTAGTSLLDIVLMVWLLGIIIFLAYQLIGYYIFKKKVLRWSNAPKDLHIENTIKTLSAQINLSKQLTPLISSAVSSPLMIGFFHPLLILPGETYSDNELALIILHELTHCKRKDLWYKLLFLTANAIHWFNPFAYLLFHEASADIELSCDDAVIANSPFEERKIYTETILSSIKKNQIKEIPLSTYFYGGAKIMKERIMNILNMNEKKHGLIAVLALVICTVFIGNLFVFTLGNNQAVFDITKDFNLSYKGNTIGLGSSDLLFLGEPKSTDLSTKFIINEGDYNQINNFDNLLIQTYISDTSKQVIYIETTNPDIMTSRGINIGSTKKNLFKAYPDMAIVAATMKLKQYWYEDDYNDAQGDRITFYLDDNDLVSNIILERKSITYNSDMHIDLTAEEAQDALEESIMHTVNGDIAFRIPMGYDNENWNILIYGRQESKTMGGMSVHYLEDINNAHNWISPNWYTIPILNTENEISDNKVFYTELWMTIYLPDNVSGEILTRNIDLMQFLDEARKS